MKYLILAFAIIVFSTSCSKEKKQINKKNNTKTTAYYFIRHAEKDRSDSLNKDPHLSKKGLFRTQHWISALKNISFDAIYSTDYNRTRETGQPIAAKSNLKLTIYDLKTIDVETFLKDTKGKSVLIVGHSNSTPTFVNAVLGTQEYEHMDDANNANLYIVTLSEDSKSHLLLNID